MKINYADRRNDKNILEKDFKIIDITYREMAGKASIIKIRKVNNEFIVTRPDGSQDLLIANDYKLMTFFPKDENYCITVMYDKYWNLLQWYFDVTKSICKYDSSDIPYSEDLYLDVVVLQDGRFYTLDEDELEEALNKNLISKDEYDMAYITINKIIQMIRSKFGILCDFTNFCLEKLK